MSCIRNEEMISKLTFKHLYNKYKKMKYIHIIVFFAFIAITTTINVEFHDGFGGMRKISIPACKIEPCNIVQGVPLVTYITFAPESPKWPQGKTFTKFTTGYLSTMMSGYGNLFGVGLTNGTDLTDYYPNFPINPKQLSTAKVPLIAPCIDPALGPFKSTGKKFMEYLVNVGNETDFITVASASITLNVIHRKRTCMSALSST